MPVEPNAGKQAGRRMLGRLQKGLALFGLWLVGVWHLVSRRRQSYNILRLELFGPLAAHEDGGVKGLFGLGGIDFPTLVAVLKWAREDPRLEVVSLTIHRLNGGWALVEEVRRSLLALRERGKTVWAYLLEPGLKEYYLGSAADRVLLPPAALFDVTGIATEVTFLKGALEKLGIEAQITQVGRYKSLGEMFTRGEMSPHHREMVESVIDDLYRQIVGAIAASRALDEERFAELIRSGPHVAKEALEKGLVDVLVYPDELEELARRELGEPKVITLAAYRRQRGLEMRKLARERNAPKVALVELTGPVKMGSSPPATDGVRATGARTFEREIQGLKDDPGIQGVVIRINSPGGSALASDLMWRSVMKLKEEKPVVVSFGEVAASGGYYVGMAGERVVCGGTAITGSIGVLAGKAVLRGLYEQLGITKEIVSRGASPSLYSDYLPLDEKSAEKVLAEAQSFYDDFVAKVAQCRGMDRLEAASLAEGRVWSGRQAVENGLADEIGGIEEALERLKKTIGVPPTGLLAVERVVPRRKWFRLQRALPPPANPLSALPFAGDSLRWLAQALFAWWRHDSILALAATGLALGICERGAAGDPLSAPLDDFPWWRRFAAVFRDSRPSRFPF